VGQTRQSSRGDSDPSEKRVSGTYELAVTCHGCVHTGRRARSCAIIVGAGYVDSGSARVTTFERLAENNPWKSKSNLDWPGGRDYGLFCLYTPECEPAYWPRMCPGERTELACYFWRRSCNRPYRCRLTLPNQEGMIE